MWEPMPYKVVQQPNPSRTVFEVRPECRHGPMCTVNRNMFRPCPFEERTWKPEIESPTASVVLIWGQRLVDVPVPEPQEQKGELTSQWEESRGVPLRPNKQPH